MKAERWRKSIGINRQDKMTAHDKNDFFEKGKQCKREIKNEERERKRNWEKKGKESPKGQQSVSLNSPDPSEAERVHDWLSTLGQWPQFR